MFRFSTTAVVILSICSFFSFINSQECKFEYTDLDIPNPEGIVITNSEYADADTCVDLIWGFSEKVEIKVQLLDIDGQSGDFVLLSSNPTLTKPPANVKSALPVGEFMIFSWMNKNVTVNILSPAGSFLYFHGEDGEREEFQKGFQIEVFPFERIYPTMAPTTEKAYPTPQQGVEAFVIRFLTGKDPDDFVRSLEQFKEVIAGMANSYCAEGSCNLLEAVGSDDILVPSHEIRYCDEKWPQYRDGCVEVMFAIAVVDMNEEYAMGKTKIDQMWELYKNNLTELGLQPLEPPETEADIVPWIWMAATLGVIIAFIAGFCVVWLRSNETGDPNRNVKLAEGVTDEFTPNYLFFDPANPIISNHQNGIPEGFELKVAPSPIRRYRPNDLQFHRVNEFPHTLL